MFKRITYIIKIIFITCVSMGLLSCSQKTEKTELTFSVAASLKDAMEVIAQRYQDENPHIQIRFNFGGSGALAQQIRQGAPVDLFFSADKQQFTELAKENYVEKSFNLLENKLVLVARKDNQLSIKDFQDLNSEEIKKIAMGATETVPAGKYTQEVLKNLNIWDELEPKFVFTKDVREVLSYVETNNVEAGVVYQTDALTSNKIKIISTAEPALHSPIVYTVGILKNTKEIKAVDSFYTFLQQEEIKQVFIDHGFTIR